METPDLDAILSQDNPDIDVFGTSPVAEPVQAETPEPEQQPEVPTTTTATDANPFDDGSAQHKAFERLREAERGRAEAEREAAVLRAIQERDQQWQQSMQQAPQQQREEAPDPIVDPEAYAVWVERQIEARVSAVEQKFEQREQQRQAQEFERQTQALIASTGVPVETLQAALAHVQKAEPWMVAGLNNAPNPFKAVLDHAKRIGFDAPAAPAQSAPSNSIPDHIRQQVLADEAAKRAAAGLPPQMQTPRGVGGGPSGAGFRDELPPPSEFGKLSQSEYEAVKAKILSQ
jgi:hypothetical protein